MWWRMEAATPPRTCANKGARHGQLHNATYVLHQRPEPLRTFHNIPENSRSLRKIQEVLENYGKAQGETRGQSCQLSSARHHTSSILASEIHVQVFYSLLPSRKLVITMS